MECAACRATLDPSRVVGRRASRTEEGDRLLIASFSCVRCLAVSESTTSEMIIPEWSAPVLVAPSATVTRLRERLADMSRTELLALLRDDVTASALSTPELERDVREALGPSVRMKWNVTPFAHLWPREEAGLPMLPPTLSSQCRQALLRSELDTVEGGVYRGEGGALIVRGTPFALRSLREGWLVVQLPDEVMAVLRQRKRTDPLEDRFLVDPALVAAD